MSVPSFLFNCRQATLLIERSADERLSPQARVQLWAHLRLCPYCRRYELQSKLIARLAQASTKTRVPPDLVLPAAARARLQQLLAAAAAAQPAASKL